MAIGLERIVARPYLLHDFGAGIVAVRMDGNEPPAGSESVRKRRNNLLRLEFSRRAGAVGL